ncbi:MAG: multiheme c-type cytochrome [Planctomycetaceae bacterium]
MSAAPNSSGFKVLLIATIALALFLAVIFMGIIGPQDEPDLNGDPMAGGPGAASTSDEPGFDPTALQFKTWPAPAAALILSGEQHGYFEPCGCTENQSGGFSRRGDLIRQVQELGWKTAGLDVGGLLKRNGVQAQVKFKTMLTALKDLNYKAFALGVEEVKLGADVVVSSNFEDNPLAFLSSNVTFYEAPELGTPVRTKVFDHGGIKFGVTSVLGDSLKPELGQVSDVTVEPASAAIKATLGQLASATVDMKILLSHGSMKEAEKFAAEFPEFNLIVTTGGAEDPDGRPAQVGDTVLLNVGKKGKHAGVLAIYPNDEPKFRFELVQLDRDRFGDSPAMIEHMRTYQQQLEAQQVSIQESAVGHPTGASFVGSDACADCHEEEYDIWKKSPHAKAFLSLDPSNEGHGYERLKGIPRLHDPECLCCHVTGWNPQDVYRYRSGFINESLADAVGEDPERMPLLVGSGCENCHGPGSRHIELAEEGEDELAAKEVRFTLEQAKSSNGCYKCHDLDNSPTFDFEEYWPKIAH